MVMKKSHYEKLLAQVEAPDTSGIHDILGRVEKALIEDVLDVTGWNKAKTARILQTKRTTLIAKMHRLAIPLDRPPAAQDLG